MHEISLTEMRDVIIPSSANSVTVYKIIVVL